MFKKVAGSIKNLDLARDKDLRTRSLDLVLWPNGSYTIYKRDEINLDELLDYGGTPIWRGMQFKYSHPKFRSFSTFITLFTQLNFS